MDQQRENYGCVCVAVPPGRSLIRKVFHRSVNTNYEDGRSLWLPRSTAGPVRLRTLQSFLQMDRELFAKIMI